ncbi:MAG: S8 family serine peptidase [Mycobacteriales bacterium]
MRRFATPLALIASVAVTASAATLVTAPPSAADPARATPAAAPVTVTLVTGDRVHIGPGSTGGHPTYQVEPAPGHTAGFHASYGADGHLHVVPADLERLVPDVLDPALFDVTALVAMGYDDAHRDTLPLIVTPPAGLAAAATASPLLHRQRALPSVHAEAVTLSRTDAAGFGRQLESSARTAGATAGLTRIALDARVRAADLDTNLVQIGAPQAWQAGLSGDGVTVAVLDTGVDTTHPDLAGRVADSETFTDEPATDTSGHGTHVASLLAGSGAAAGGARRGVAYASHLISGKVLDGNGEGYASWVIAGMQWAVAQGARVVNLSLGAPDYGGPNPVREAVESLSASSNTLFVVAAGNKDFFNSSVNAPGTAPSALTVGAVDSADHLADFSTQGPTPANGLKPDITAPGVAITGARAAGTGSPTGGAYTQYSGTSQATPQVAGAAALLAQQHPDWPAARLKAALVETAHADPTLGPLDQGGGRLDLAAATTAPVQAVPGEVDLGLLRYPQTAPVSTVVTLSNPGTAPVTLALAGSLRQSGTAAAFTVSPASLTVPAGGTATATVTVDPTRLAAGRYDGTVTATAAAGTPIHLPVAFAVESEHYDVHMTVLGRDGKPAPDAEMLVTNVVDYAMGYYSSSIRLDAAGRATVRVVPGYYNLMARVTAPGADGVDTTALVQIPEVHVTAESAATLDARRAKPVSAAVTGVRTSPQQLDLALTRGDEQGRADTWLAFGDGTDIAAGRILITPTPAVTHGKASLNTRWRLTADKPGRGKPDLYDLMLVHHAIPDPPAFTLSRADTRALATLHVDYRAIGGAGQYQEGRSGITDEFGIALITYRPMTVPVRRIEAVTASPDVSWLQCMYVPQSELMRMCDASWRTYQAGGTVDVDRLNVFRPAPRAAERASDYLYVDLGTGDGSLVGSYPLGAAEAPRLTLSRDGTVIGDVASTFHYFPVPASAGSGTYTVTSSVGFAAAARFGQTVRTDTTWTFRSDPPSGDASTVRLPMLAVDYSPQLDSYDHARAWWPLPYTLSVNRLGQPVRPTRLEFSVSTDGGRNWQRLPLIRIGDRYTTLVPGWLLRPGAAVSTRTVATAADGGTIDQTLHDAFTVTS